MNRKASLEIGVNTIVILVIAMVLLGLGIGFIRGLFDQAGDLPGLIDTDQFDTPPTAQEPIRLTPSSIEIKRGESKEVKVGIYNKGDTADDFTVEIPACTGPDDSDDKPMVQALDAAIEPGESKGFKVIVTADTAADEAMETGKYICKLQGAGTRETYDAQFIMTVVS